MGDPVHDRAKRGILLDLQAPCRSELDGVVEPRILACKLCGGKSRVVFGLPHNKKAGHPIPQGNFDAFQVSALLVA
jgi:hypothetical protein